MISMLRTFAAELEAELNARADAFADAFRDGATDGLPVSRDEALLTYNILRTIANAVGAAWKRVPR